MGDDPKSPHFIVGTIGAYNWRGSLGLVQSIISVESCLPYPSYICGYTNPLPLFCFITETRTSVDSLLDQASLVKSGGFTICSNEAGFRNQMLDAIKGVLKSNKNVLFINSCFAHCQSERQDTWFADDSPMIEDKDGVVVPALTTCQRTETKLGKKKETRGLSLVPLVLFSSLSPPRSLLFFAHLAHRDRPCVHRPRLHRPASTVPVSLTAFSPGSTVPAAVPPSTVHRPSLPPPSLPPPSLDRPCLHQLCLHRPLPPPTLASPSPTAIPATTDFVSSLPSYLPPPSLPPLSLEEPSKVTRRALLSLLAGPSPVGMGINYHTRADMSISWRLPMGIRAEILYIVMVLLNVAN
ncbi:hypothetical protein Syun_014957 [Stephania yunnanensis]|uniref:Pectin acetylesterase n=1 Tax=Stephania yunnanensis TaxID=152371 RepID=A0AAP0JKG5_9MAGN